RVTPATGPAWRWPSASGIAHVRERHVDLLTSRPGRRGERSGSAGELLTSTERAARPGLLIPEPGGLPSQASDPRTAHGVTPRLPLPPARRKPPWQSTARPGRGEARDEAGWLSPRRVECNYRGSRGRRAGGEADKRRTQTQSPPRTAAGWGA